VSLDREAAEVFVEGVSELGFSVQRVGILYGSYSQEDGWIYVNLIYEPPQHPVLVTHSLQQQAPQNGTSIPTPIQSTTTSSAMILSDEEHLKEQEAVDAITTLLGLTRVGWILARRDSDEGFTLASWELLKAAEFQKSIDFPFLSVVVSLNEEKQTQIEAYALSDQYMDMYKHKHFLPASAQKDPTHSLLKEDVFLNTKAIRAVDNHFFLVSVGIKDHKGDLTTKFPVENRQKPATIQDLKAIVQPKATPLPPHQQNFIDRVSDFHLLLFLHKHFGIVEVQPLAECVKNHSKVDEAHELLIRALVGTV